MTHITHCHVTRFHVTATLTKINRFRCFRRFLLQRGKDRRVFSELAGRFLRRYEEVVHFGFCCVERGLEFGGERLVGSRGSGFSAYAGF